MLKLRLDEIDIFSEEKDYQELSKELTRNEKLSSKTIDFMKETSPGNYFTKELDNNDLNIVQSIGTTDPMVLTAKNQFIIKSSRHLNKTIKDNIDSRVTEVQNEYNQNYF